MKELISLHVLSADEKLPSVRQLAIDLSINPNTIQRAYSELEREGYIYSVKGRGNFVSDISTMLPSRQQEYFERLDQLLSTANGYELTKEDILSHVKDFYEGKKKGE